MEEKNLIYAIDRFTGQQFGGPFSEASAEEIDQAVDQAKNISQELRSRSAQHKVAFLESIVEELEALGENLIDTASRETALPTARIAGEKVRTVNQIKLFVDLLKEGSWENAIIETGDPSRSPLPKPDLRSVHRPIGPVAVFGASNFPLAFSVAGGDTISALAAGCPVIFKAHPAHPATSELVGNAILKAARKSGMPEGVFSMLHGAGELVGTRLVVHPDVKAVAFTGSFKVGKSIFDLAAKRPVPIPVYAEMGSVNPVFILPELAKTKADEVAAAYASAVTLGVGQFCTNPGLLVVEENSPEFFNSLPSVFKAAKGGIMLTEGMRHAYNQGVSVRKSIDQVSVLAEGEPEENGASPIILKTNVPAFEADPVLGEEVFGPASVVVAVKDKQEMMAFAKQISGSLTISIHGTAAELSDYRELIGLFEEKAGRLIVNGFPTGVEVSPAMVHGGPFPATTDERTTSVGTQAIFRFTRQVCYQGFPQDLLPDALKDLNPLGIYRKVNGVMTNKEII